MNTITISLCPEDRARLDAILDALKAGTHDCSNCVQSAVGMALNAAEPAPIAPAPQPATDPDPAPVPAPDPAPEPEPVSLAEFQKAITLRCAESAAVKSKVRELVNRFAPAVSEIPPEKRAEFLTLLAQV